jgi:hypothetical protein
MGQDERKQGRSSFLGSDTISIFNLSGTGGPGGPASGGGPRCPGWPTGLGGPSWRQTIIPVGRDPEGFEVSPDGKSFDEHFHRSRNQIDLSAFSERDRSSGIVGLAESSRDARFPHCAATDFRWKTCRFNRIRVALTNVRRVVIPPCLLAGEGRERCEQAWHAPHRERSVETRPLTPTLFRKRRGSQK